MTVIEFNTRDIRTHALYIFLGVLVIISAVLSIISYNKLMSLKHDNDDLRKAIAHAQVKNAELKNAFYERIDVRNPESYLMERGYVLETKPQYETIKKRSSDEI